MRIKTSSLVLLFLSLQATYSEASSKSWYLKNMKDKNCLKCACIGKAVDEGDRDSILRMLGGKTYNTMGSRSNYLYSYLLTTGTQPTSDSDIDRLCVSIEIELALGVYTILSPGTNFTTAMSFKSFPQISEYNVEQKHDPMEMTEKLATAYKYLTAPKRLTIVASDGSSFVLLTSCRWNGETSWFVLSTKKKLTKKIQRKVMKKVVELGFDTSKVYVPNFDSCM